MIGMWILIINTIVTYFLETISTFFIFPKWIIKQILALNLIVVLNSAHLVRHVLTKLWYLRKKRNTKDFSLFMFIYQLFTFFSFLDLYIVSISSNVIPLVSGMKKKHMRATKEQMQAYIKKAPWTPKSSCHVGVILVLTKRLKLSNIPNKPLPNDLCADGKISP